MVVGSYTRRRDIPLANLVSFAHRATVPNNINPLGSSLQMTNRLVQKHVVKGTREFELVDDEVNIKIHMPFLQKEYTVVLAVLDPEPVIKGSMLAFVSAVNREPLIEFFVDKPDPESFRDFVGLVKQRATEEDFGKPKGPENRNIDVAQLDVALQMLRSYVTDDSIQPFIASLEALRTAPDDPARFNEMYQAFNRLGSMQGAVLTYAPYLVTLFSDTE
jgi:hypothetical protein